MGDILKRIDDKLAIIKYVFGKNMKCYSWFKCLLTTTEVLGWVTVGCVS